MAVRDVDVHLLLRLRVVEALDERDPLHVLRLLERVGHVVGPDDAEAEVDAVAEEPAHLHVDRGAAGRDRQVPGRRQLDDPSVYEDPL
jgi:hypothetical protein